MPPQGTDGGVGAWHATQGFTLGCRVCRLRRREMLHKTVFDLTSDQQQALAENHGFVRGSSYVLMSIDVFRNTMGAETDEETAASLKAIEEGLADVEAGRTKPMDQVFRELDEKYGVHS